MCEWATGIPQVMVAVHDRAIWLDDSLLRQCQPLVLLAVHEGGLEPHSCVHHGFCHTLTESLSSLSPGETNVANWGRRQSAIDHIRIWPPLRARRRETATTFKLLRAWNGVEWC
jgi:hypothetical protein